MVRHISLSSFDSGDFYDREVDGVAFEEEASPPEPRRRLVSTKASISIRSVPPPPPTERVVTGSNVEEFTPQW